VWSTSGAYRSALHSWHGLSRPGYPPARGGSRCAAIAARRNRFGSIARKASTHVVEHHVLRFPATGRAHHVHAPRVRSAFRMTARRPHADDTTHPDGLSGEPAGNIRRSVTARPRRR
jgi:hypothetical protein